MFMSPNERGSQQGLGPDGLSLRIEHRMTFAHWEASRPGQRAWMFISPNFQIRHVPFLGSIG